MTMRRAASPTPPLPPFLLSPENKKYPAKSHLARVISHLSPPPASVIYLEAAKSKLWPDCDQEQAYRADRSFYYASGCDLPDCVVVVEVGEDGGGKKAEEGRGRVKRLTLFVPPVVEEEVVWCGLPLSVEEAGELYDTDEVLTTASLPDRLANLPDGTTLYTIRDPSCPLPSHVTLNTTHLRPSLTASRLTKSPHELALMRHAQTITAQAHSAVLSRAPTARNESQLAALFTERCAAHGCPHQAYSPIVASGTDAATLHYVRNNKAIGGETGHLNLLLDAGCEYQCYASDVTRTFPLNGKFTRESRDVYEIVLRMQKECMALVRGGMQWEDVHAHAHRVAIDGLLALGILHGDKEAIFASRVSCAFFPHGLGHYLGLDTHDTGGNAVPPDREPDPMFKYLRIRGTVPAGAVVTVEPGVYFCRFILVPALKDERQKGFVDEGVLERYWSVGGVRIEDDVLVLEGGCENLTGVEREVEGIEALMAEE